MEHIKSGQGQPMTQDEKGNWIPAKQIPYVNTPIEAIKCFFGAHEWFESKKYDRTDVCFRCGKRNCYFFGGKKKTKKS